MNTDSIKTITMNSRFAKYLRALQAKEEVEQVKSDLHKTFALLTQEEQKYAGIFLRDIERGDVIVEDGKTLRDYITEYQTRAKADQIHHGDRPGIHLTPLGPRAGMNTHSPSRIGLAPTGIIRTRTL